MKRRSLRMLFCISLWIQNSFLPVYAEETVIQEEDSSEMNSENEDTVKETEEFEEIIEIESDEGGEEHEEPEDYEDVEITEETETSELSADASVIGDLKYEINVGKVIITGYTGTPETIVIPEEIEGYPVTTIRYNAFKGCTSLKELEIPESVTELGYSMIEGTAVETITVPKSVAKVTYTSNSYGAFQDADNLTEVVFEDGMEKIPDYLCRNTKSLKKVVLPESLKEIGNNAFENCASLSEVVFPGSLEKIGNSSFSRCTSLEAVSLPESLLAIGANAFSRCTSLKEIEISGKVSEIGSGVFNGCASLEKAVIPGSVKNIGSSAFSGCTSLSNVAMGEGVEKIGSSAFKGCTSLKELEIPESVTELGYSMIEGTAVETITVPKSVAKVTYTSNSYGAFQDADNLTEVVFEDGMEKIPDYLCRNTKSLKKVVLPESLKEIGNNAFENCASLSEVVFPGSLEKIGSNAFSGCTKLEEIEFPESLTSIENNAFIKCSSLKEIATGSNVASIGNSAFKDCQSLEKADISGSVKSIGVSAFSGCTSLAEVTIGEGTEKIGSNAFENCGSLKQLDIPESVTELGNSIISGTAIESITVPKGVAKVTYTSNSYGAFQDADNLTEVIFEEGIEKIPAFICNNTSSLVSIGLPKSVKEIGNNAFSKCPELTTVELPEGLEKIGSNAFDSCSSLTALRIPDSVTSVSANSFANCPNLTVYCYSGSAAHMTLENTSVSYVLFDEHEHAFEITKQKDPTCSRKGSITEVCSICGYSKVTFIDATGHQYVDEIVEPGCTERGYVLHTCTVCGHKYSDSYTEPVGHSFGEWIIDTPATIFHEGEQHRECSVCGKTEKEIIEKKTVDINTDTSYGMGVFTVVHAQTLEPISNAHIFVSTEEGEDTFDTDENGNVRIVLPIGDQTVSVYAENCLTRNIPIKVHSGVNEYPEIGISDKPTYDAKITSRELSYDEIVELGIDTSDPSNNHVFKYELLIEFEPELDLESLAAYFNNDGICIGGGYMPSNDDGDSDVDEGDHDNKGGVRSVIWINCERQSGNGNPRGYFRIETDEEPIIIYPVKEYFYIIVRGEVRWLKEMFDVEMLVINNSMTDTMENVSATLELPEGLSLAKMVGEQQNLTHEIGTLEGGESEAVHWYVRGDKAGSYSLNARLQGTLMPFNETIDDIFTSEDELQVWAGGALHLHFDFPKTAYYGQDYPIIITLTNVSDKPLYKLNHKVQIEQGMIYYYDDGSTREKIEKSKWESKSAHVFYPGDKMIIEASVNIFFRSPLTERKLNQIIKQINKFEKVSNGLKQAQKAINAVDKALTAASSLVSSISKCSKAMDNFIANAPTDTAKLEMFKTLHNEITGLYLKYYKSGDKVLDAGVMLANSGLKTTLDAITKDPDKFLKENGKDLEKILEKVHNLGDAIQNKKMPTQNFDIFDALRNVVSSIPIKFVVSNVVMSEDEDNTTHIPWSYTVSDTGPQYFGISNVSRYLTSVIRVGMADMLTDEMKKVPSYYHLLDGIDDPFNREEAVRYATAVQEEMNEFKAKDASGNVTFRAWIQRADPWTRSLKSAPGITSENFTLSCDNENSTYENGVLTFTGDTTIYLVPHTFEDGVLHIEDSEGNTYEYAVHVVPQHECHAGEMETVIPPIDDIDGFGVKRCEICEDILEVIPLSAENICTEHTYGEWKIETEATCQHTGARVKTCSVCGHEEMEFIEKTGHNWGEWHTVKEATSKEKGLKERLCNTCDEKETEEIPALDKIQFDDVQDAKKSYYDAVYWAVDHEITQGTSKEPPLFSPFNNCTRAQFVTFLWRQQGKPEPKTTKSPFSDVQDKNLSYYKAVLWALEKGITTGTSPTEFSPGKPCTRAQVVTFLWRAQGQPEPTIKTNPFTDVPAGRSFSKAVLWAFENNITTGTSKTEFSPTKTCTRAQTVTFLYRTYKE